MKKDDFYILVVDDEPTIGQSLLDIINDEGWRGTHCKDGLSGIESFKNDRPDCVLLDIWMPGIDGITVLQKLKEIDGKVPVIIMSGHATIDIAVKATKLGAFDVLEKPLTLDKLIELLGHIEERKNNLNHKSEIHPESDFIAGDFVGEAGKILEIKKLLKLVASKNSWVLITGENGSGKEVLAQAIHQESIRSARPFIAVNCAAIPEELIESELFGHVKGAFTNAIKPKEGKFELADKGTLFLDEIADMSLKTQAKILRILQEQKFERVGGTQTIHVDVRVIAATNKNLKQEMLNGRFREDLYFRLNVVPVHMPPLRERGGDIILLADFFLKKNAEQYQEKQKKLDESAKAVLIKYPWPGNVRELKNMMERLSIFVSEPIITEKHLTDLDLNILSEDIEFGGSYSGSLREAKSEFEKQYIIEKLEEFDWNVSKTAEAIGIERSNLHRKLRAFNLDPKRLKG